MRGWVVDGLRWLLLALPVGVIAAGRVRGGMGAADLVWGLVVLAVAVRRRRTAPYPAVAAAAVLSVLEPAFGVALAYLAYGAGRRRDDPGRAAAVLAGGVTAATLLHGPVLRDAYAWVLAVVVLLLAGALPWACGRLLADRRELAVAGWRRAADLEREQQVVAAQARLLERTRIARDLHDSLGHELSLIALRAGALELEEGLGTEARQAAGALRADVAAAVERLREAVEVLSDGPASTLPVHESVADLVARARAAGLDVDLRATGAPVAVDPAADLAVHRVVQEALTNAVKHAPDAAITVALDHHPERVDLRISNAVSARTGDGRTGSGLTGLRERLDLVGGTLAARRQGNHFLVEASVPVHPSGRAAAPEPVGAPGTGVVHAAGRQRVRRGLLLAAAAVCAAVLVVTAFWVAMTHDATLDRPTYERIAVGASRADLAGLLPRRQATRGWTGRLLSAPEGPLDCSFYSDGNYPAAFATYRVCFSADVLVSKDDIRGGTGS